MTILSCTNFSITNWFKMEEYAERMRVGLAGFWGRRMDVDD